MKRRPFLVDDAMIWIFILVAGVIGALVLQYITHTPTQ